MCVLSTIIMRRAASILQELCNSLLYIGTKPQVYFLGVIDVLTVYGARKRAAHAAKTMKHGVSCYIQVNCAVYISAPMC